MIVCTTRTRKLHQIVFNSYNNYRNATNKRTGRL